MKAKQKLKQQEEREKTDGSLSKFDTKRNSDISCMTDVCGSIHDTDNPTLRRIFRIRSYKLTHLFISK